MENIKEESRELNVTKLERLLGSLEVLKVDWLSTEEIGESSRKKCVE